MDVRAHVLFQIDPGRCEEAVGHLTGLPFVEGAVATSGAYDVIATVRAPSGDELARTVSQARRTPGLCALRLCRVA